MAAEAPAPSKRQEHNRPETHVFDLAYFASKGAASPTSPPPTAASRTSPTPPGPDTACVCVAEGLGAGDSALYLNVLPPAQAGTAFADLREECAWSEMQHKGGPVPRLVCIQGTSDPDGTRPVYRHPADEQPALLPWTPVSLRLRERVEKVVGQRLNHALIQHYRGGRDYISEHADKSLDIRRGTVIVNLSLGATRVMVLRTKRKGEGRVVQRVTLPHNSLFVLGWETNRTWTHEIRQDKRRLAEKRADELRDDGERISLTFRDIATFLRPSDGRLLGQGAVCKALPKPGEGEGEGEGGAAGAGAAGAEGEDGGEGAAATAAEAEAALQMLKAFGDENRNPEFDWDAAYGCGFDTLNFRVLNVKPREGAAEPGEQDAAPVSGT